MAYPGRVAGLTVTGTTPGASAAIQWESEFLVEAILHCMLLMVLPVSQRHYGFGISDYLSRHLWDYYTNRDNNPEEDIESVVSYKGV